MALSKRHGSRRTRECHGSAGSRSTTNDTNYPNRTYKRKAARR